MFWTVLHNCELKQQQKRQLIVNAEQRGADTVIFGTCLYVEAAAFIGEFQGSPLV